MSPGRADALFLVFAGILGTLASLYVWLALWENDLAIWDNFGVTVLAWFGLPAAITGLIGLPRVRRTGMTLAVACATSGSVGFFLTYIAFILDSAAEFGS